MNWLIDAQLPARLGRLLRERGEDGNHPTDAALLAVAERDDRIVITRMPISSSAFASRADHAASC